jgi:hypothetical protein
MGKDQTTDSYWKRVLDLADMFAKGEQCPGNAVDVEASLFPPESSNAW